MPTRSSITKGSRVLIETKENQGTGRLTEGTVKEMLTAGNSHPHGIKVRLDDGQVGRVKQVTVMKGTVKPQFVDLSKKEIPKTEDKYNEFKEFYQYDEKIERLSSDKEKSNAIDGIKHSVQKRFAIAVCSFGNSHKGGFVYLGIRSDGSIAGLDRDKKFGGFSDYNDSFANHIKDRLEDFLKDRVFITSKVEMRFRTIDDKTICIIQVLPADRPLYLNDKEKAFFVRGASPRAEKLDVEEQFRYIKERFPHHH